MGSQVPTKLLKLAPSRSLGTAVHQVPEALQGRSRRQKDNRERQMSGNYSWLFFIWTLVIYSVLTH
jgi:hypothetical protein